MSQEILRIETTAETHSRLGRLYQGIYDRLCGRHPELRPWHFQWHSTRALYRDLRELLPSLSGKVLDVGCGDKPYKTLSPQASEWIGLDVYPGAAVDFVVSPGDRWPFEDATFDAVVCTHVIPRVEDTHHMFSEIARVLKPHGKAVVSGPFAYGELAGHDYCRFSAHGLAHAVARHLEPIEIRRQGGIGSTMATLFLVWCESQLNLSVVGRHTKGLMLPMWILVAGIVNVVGLVFDRLDRTQAFYGNVLVMARKRCT